MSDLYRWILDIVIYFIVVIIAFISYPPLSRVVFNKLRQLYLLRYFLMLVILSLLLMFYDYHQYSYGLLIVLPL